MSSFMCVLVDSYNLRVFILLFLKFYYYKKLCVSLLCINYKVQVVKNYVVNKNVEVI